MLAIPHMARQVGPRRVIRSKIWAIASYRASMLRHPLSALAFVLLDPELDNFTYDLSNRDELVDFLAQTLGQSREATAAIVHELERDDAFRGELNERLRGRADRKSTALYGRRAGWYALVRMLRPSLVVETGVHDGLGSSVLLQALYRNRADGHAGRLVGIDINPRAGWLVPPRLREHFTLVIEDSATAIPRLAQEQAIDLFIHDSDHSYKHEWTEFQLAATGLPRQGVLLSDNAHATSALRDFAVATGRKYAYWQERPRHHFYPGAGIGISLPS